MKAWPWQSIGSTDRSFERDNPDRGDGASRWRDVFVIVKPETLIGWHRKGFKLFRQLKSRRRAGRPKIPKGLSNDCPEPRTVDPPENGRVMSMPVLGGLHHRYRRKAV